MRDLILFAGGAYLVYKGISELRDLLALKEQKEEAATGVEGGKRIVTSFLLAAERYVQLRGVQACERKRASRYYRH